MTNSAWMWEDAAAVPRAFEGSVGFRRGDLLGFGEWVTHDVKIVDVEVRGCIIDLL